MTMKKRKIKVLELSGATGAGIPELLDAVAKVLYAVDAPKPKAKVRHAERPAPKAKAPKKTRGKEPTRGIPEQKRKGSRG